MVKFKTFDNKESKENGFAIAAEYTKLCSVTCPRLAWHGQDLL